MGQLCRPSVHSRQTPLRRNCQRSLMLCTSGTSGPPCPGIPDACPQVEGAPHADLAFQPAAQFGPLMDQVRGAAQALPAHAHRPSRARHCQPVGAELGAPAMASPPTAPPHPFPTLPPGARCTPSYLRGWPASRAAPSSTTSSACRRTSATARPTTTRQVSSPNPKDNSWQPLAVPRVPHASLMNQLCHG